MSPRSHGNWKFMIEYAVTKAMVQSTFVPSLVNNKASFIVFIAN
jgi:hypothetical protein